VAGTTDRLGLYLPGGGSSGAYGENETADIDRINGNFVILDDWAEGQEGREAVDWNTALLPGAYWGNSATNAPETGLTGGRVFLVGTRIVQEVFKADITASSLVRTWRRVSSTGGATWTAWYLTTPGLVQGRILGSGLDQPVSGSGYTVVNFEGASASYTDGVTWNGTDERFEITQAGWYQVTSTILFRPGSAGLSTGIVASAVFFNGNVAGETVQRTVPPNENDFSQVANCDRNLSVGHYVDIRTVRSSVLTGALVIHAALSIRMTRPA
jgi:hypothetical protein